MIIEYLDAFVKNTDYISFLLEDKYKFLYSLFIFILFFVVSKLVVYISEKVILQLTKNTKTKIDDLIVEAINNPISLIIIIYGIKFALIPLNLSENIVLLLNNIMQTLLILIMTVIIIKIADILLENWGEKWAKKTKSSIDDELIGLGRTAIKIVFYILGFIYVLGAWGIEVMPLLGGLGIGGIAIAFALQKSLANIFGGISLILDENVKEGQIIKLDDLTSGEIMNVGFRSTKIKNWDSQIVIVPNGVLAETVFTNISQPTNQVRVVVPFSVEYGSDIEKVKKIALKEIKEIKSCLNDPKPLVRFLEMADSALNFKAFFHVETFGEAYSSLDEANTRLYNALNKAGIGIPFPQMDVHLKEKNYQNK
ncbi:MAG: mechanosensitive ion channel family protein [Candidatus Woesearchaeota archaeon]